MDTLVGITLGQYQLSELIGRGGMATVYRAHQSAMNRDVALKVIEAKSETFAARFADEAQMLARLSHPHILKVFDYGRDADRLYLVMELLTGGTLRRLILQSIPLDRVEALLAQIADALNYAHGKGIIHRDVKPHNILLDESRNAFLADFGIARLRDALLETTFDGTIRGTPAYMAPEQCRGGSLSPQTDIYALGVVVFEMLTGQTPFYGDSSDAVMYQHIYEAPPPLQQFRPELAPAVGNVLERALSKDPKDRYPSAVEFAGAFSSALNGVREIVGSPISGSPRTEGRRIAAVIDPDRETRQEGRRLDAAMPAQTQVDRPTEVWVQICLPESEGFKPLLPLETRSHEEIAAPDVREGQLAVLFQVESGTGQLMSSLLIVELTAPDFRVALNPQELILPSTSDSGKLIFSLTPVRAQKRSLVHVSARQRLSNGQTINLGAASLSAEILPVGTELLLQRAWTLISLPLMAFERGRRDAGRAGADGVPKPAAAAPPMPRPIERWLDDALSLEPENARGADIGPSLPSRMPDWLEPGDSNSETAKTGESVASEISSTPGTASGPPVSAYAVPAPPSAEREQPMSFRSAPIPQQSTATLPPVQARKSARRGFWTALSVALAAVCSASYLLLVQLPMASSPPVQATAPSPGSPVEAASSAPSTGILAIGIVIVLLIGTAVFARLRRR